MYMYVYMYILWICACSTNWKEVSRLYKTDIKKLNVDMYKAVIGFFLFFQQIWVKTPEVLARDRLLGSFSVSS